RSHAGTSSAGGAAAAATIATIPGTDCPERHARARSQRDCTGTARTSRLRNGPVAGVGPTQGRAGCRGRVDSGLEDPDLAEGLRLVRGEPHRVREVAGVLPVR